MFRAYILRMPSGWYQTFMASRGVEVGSRESSPARYTGPPMDLANMRKNGAHALRVDCLDCYRWSSVNVDDQPGHLAVPSFAGHMKCSACGSKRTAVRPHWP